MNENFSIRDYPQPARRNLVQTGRLEPQIPMNSGEPLYLNEEQVRKHLRMEDLIPAMAKALIDFSTGKVTQPVRQVITVDPPGGFYGLMPALTPEGLGQKIVTFYPPNAKRGIPTHMALIVLNDPQTGAPLAVMDGRLITEMRTAAVSAAAEEATSPVAAHPGTGSDGSEDFAAAGDQAPGEHAPHAAARFAGGGAATDRAGDSPRRGGPPG